MITVYQYIVEVYLKILAEHVKRLLNMANVSLNMANVTFNVANVILNMVFPRCDLSLNETCIHMILMTNYYPIEINLPRHLSRDKHIC
jgi:hypothetical protein